MAMARACEDRVAVPGHASLLEQVGAYYAWRSAGAGCERNPPTHPLSHLCKGHGRLRLAGWMQLLSIACTFCILQSIKALASYQALCALPN